MASISAFDGPSVRLYIMIKFIFFSVLLLNSINVFATPIVVLGDSISAGYQIDKNLGWVSLMQKKIHAHKLNYVIHNESITGDTSAGGLDRINFVLARYNPKIVLLELGVNDGLLGRPAYIIKKNLREIIKRSQAAGAKVLLLSMRIPKKTKHDKRYSNMFYNTYILLGKELNIPVVPFILEDVALYSELMQPDRIHPNVHAQEHIVDDIWPYLLPMLKQ